MIPTPLEPKIYVSSAIKSSIYATLLGSSNLDNHGIREPLNCKCSAYLVCIFCIHKIFWSIVTMTKFGVLSLLAIEFYPIILFVFLIGMVSSMWFSTFYILKRGLVLKSPHSQRVIQCRIFDEIIGSHNRKLFCKLHLICLSQDSITNSQYRLQPLSNNI